MKHLLILTLLFSLTPKPAKADPVTLLICIGVAHMILVNYAFGKVNEEKKEDNAK